MRILVVSGIWPPEVGGPASHAPEVAAYLAARGHQVEAATMADGEPEPQPFRVHWADRGAPIGIRHARAVLLIRRVAEPANVIYTTGMFGRTALAASLAQRPYVVKLTADPAFERARNRGLFRGSLEEYQRSRDTRSAPLRAVRNAAIRRAAHVVCPSAYLRELAVGWGVARECVSVLPNPAPPLPQLRPAAQLRHELGLNGRTLAFAGRLTAQKSLEIAFEALARTDGVSLVVAGEGPQEDVLRRRAAELGLETRVRFLGAQPRERVLELFSAADAALLSSSWENFPHTVVEALAVGTPVVATTTGGVGEVVAHERNGLLVEPGDAEALAAAIRRYFEDEALRARLEAAAPASVAEYAPERIYARLEEILESAARGS